LVVLNPGHDGGNGSHPDAINKLVPADREGTLKACDTAGTTANNGYTEHEFNFDVALRVQALLQAAGVRVTLTRTDDNSVGPCVDKRADIGNGADVAAAISIHADDAPESAHGFHISEWRDPSTDAAVAAASHRLTVAVHDAMVNGSGMTTSTYLGSDGYYPRDDLAGLALATRPATFLECGNMKNAADAAIQTAEAGRQQVATAIATGIIAFLTS
jgi:N-acetylmuramoyl-L-alanine amidase